MKSTRITVVAIETQRRLMATYHGLAFLLVILHLYVATRPPTATALPAPSDPESRWWGLWPVTFVPHWALWIGTLLVVAALLWAWWYSARPSASASPESLPFGWWIATALLLFVAFSALPIVHTRWGDAYILANSIGWPDPAQRLTHSWQAPLDVYLHSVIWRAFHGAMEWQDATPVYRLLSPIAGAMYLSIVLALSRHRRFAPGWLTFGLLTSLGLIQLFFGYIENYSFAAAGILAYLWLGLGVLDGRRPLWLAATVLATTNAFHPSTIVYAPSLVYLGWHHTTQRSDPPAFQRFNVLWKRLTHIAVPMLLIAGATVILMETGGHGVDALFSNDRPGGGDGRWFIPLLSTETRWEHYTLLSWLHIRDVLNQQLLVAPAVLPSLLIGGIGTLRAAIRSNNWDEYRGANCPRPRRVWGYLLLAAGAHLLLICFWNPDYGGQRDWDLFSLASIPSALLLAWALPRWLSDYRLLRAAAVPLLLIQTLHTAAWIYQNRLPWEWPS